MSVCDFLPSSFDHPLRALYGAQGEILRREGFLVLLSRLPRNFCAKDVENAMREVLFAPSYVKSVRVRLKVLAKRGLLLRTKPDVSVTWTLTPQGHEVIDRILASAALLESAPAPDAP